MKNAITLILGPTAVGKSAYALELARAQQGQIISADAFQVYRGMDIGTAKVSQAIRGEIPHHLIDIITPSESYSVANFLNEVNPLVESLQEKQIPSIICGGTGFYLYAFLHQFTLSQAPSDPSVRTALMQEAEIVGQAVLWERLHQIDPAYTAKVSCNDTKRIIRGLEIYTQTGHLPSQFQQQAEPRTDVRLVGLSAAKEVLHARINQRVDAMIKEGLIEEVEGLLAQGIPPDCQAFEALGYKEVVQYLSHRLTQEEMVELVKLRTRQFAKRQMTWFKRFKNVEWISIEH